MKIQNESAPAKTPETTISLLEKDAHTRAGKFTTHQEKISGLEIPLDLNRLKKYEYDELLTTARKEVLENNDLLESIFYAITSKTQSGSVIGFAKVENILVEKCINLTEDDIDNLIRHLGRKFLDYVRSDNRMLEVAGRFREDLITGRFNINSKGIKSVITFVRERTRLLLSGPSQNFIIGFNNRLDASRKIDLIEIIFGETNLTIEQLNFIQIKSSLPSDEDLANITREHQNFANNNILNLKDTQDSEPPANRININLVNSLIAIGPKVIKQTEVYNSKQNSGNTLLATS